jgi:hypothetical protein
MYVPGEYDVVATQVMMGICGALALTVGPALLLVVFLALVVLSFYFAYQRDRYNQLFNVRGRNA